MEPEDQSRHSRIKPEPATIDLSAEEVKTSPAADSDGIEENVTAEPAAETNAGSETAAEAESASRAAGANEATAAPGDVTPAATAAAEARSRSYSGIPNAQPASSADTAARPPASQRTPGSLGLIAASLVGGVIALAGAAGLQYWGVLPSLGSDDKTEASLNLMSGEIEALKGRLAEQAAATPKIDLSPVESKLAALEEKVAKVPEANGLSADADARLSALAEQVKAAEAAGTTLKTDAETARAALEMRIEAIEKKLAQPRDDVEVAVAIASAGLKAAIDRGGPFVAELQTLRGIDPENAAAKELEAFASTGVPSRAKLVADFPDVADAILLSAQADDPNQSFTDRLLSSAFSAIQVRPVGEVEGEGPDAVVARMETRLTNGDLVAAAAEWDKLPDAAKTVSANYKKSLDARIRVEQLVGATLSKAVSATKSDG
jgi:hypothetical protein